MEDTALNDFLSRFGDTDPDKETVQKRKPVESVNGLKPTGLVGGLARGLQNTDESVGTPETEGMTDVLTEGITTTKDDISKVTKSKIAETGGEGGLAKAMGGVDPAAAIASGGKLLGNIKGDQFDTSGEGAGPGKAGGAIFEGGTDAMAFASSVGLKDPLSQGIAAVAGGLVSTFAHKSAMKEFRSNQKTVSKAEDAISQARSDSEYAQEQGLASNEALKTLRSKQLGLSNRGTSLG